MKVNDYIYIVRIEIGASFKNLSLTIRLRDAFVDCSVLGNSK